MAGSTATPTVRVAFLTGITGQDGSYLAEFLLEKGYYVYGMIRRSSTFNTGRLRPIRGNTRLVLKYGDITDSSNISGILDSIKKAHPNIERLEIYHLCAQSHVQVSFEVPEYTGNVDAVGTTKLLESMRASGWIEKMRLYNATTSELYGKVQAIPQDENTPFYPRSPYAVAKLYSFWIVKNYREAYGIYACNGILFNHTSPRRGENFILRKITMGVAKIMHGFDNKLVLGNLNAQRDLGHAQDYIEGMWMMLQQDQPDDFVLATGVTHTVRTLVEKSFKTQNIEIEWQGEGVKEVGLEKGTGRVLVTVSPKYFRPTEVDLLLGSPAKAEKILGWAPKRTIDDIINEMIAHDMKHTEELQY